jgi:hypothetical protein
VAVNVCPEVLVFEPSVWSRTTVISVAAGTMSGFTSTTLLGSDFAASDFAGSELGEEVSVVAC